MTEQVYCENCKKYTDHEGLRCTKCNIEYDPARKRYVITGPETDEDTIKAKKELLEKDPSAIIIPEEVAFEHRMRNWKKFPTIGEPKIQRNELCPCGSGKKYKKCCIDK